MYPEFTPLLTVRGRLLDQIGRPASAVLAWSAAHDLNPFNAEVQQALVEDFTVLGKPADAARHRAILRILQTGGAASTSR
jgi:hypothetical protein